LRAIDERERETDRGVEVRRQLEHSRYSQPI